MLGEKIRAKIRGLLGLGLVGGVLGLFGGAIWSLVSTLLRLGFFVDSGFWSYVADRVLGAAIIWGMVGVFTGSGFGTLLAVMDSRRSLDELPLWRMALFGAIAGAAFEPVYVLVRFGVGPLLASPLQMLPYMGIFGTLGAMLTSSLVVMAQRVHRAELSAVQEVTAFLEGAEGVRDESPGAT